MSSESEDTAISTSPRTLYKDPDDGRQRLLLELEFVQCLANPTYIHCKLELVHRQQFYFWKNFKNNRLKHIISRSQLQAAAATPASVSPPPTPPTAIAVVSPPSTPPTTIAVTAPIDPPESSIAVTSSATATVQEISSGVDR
ncbi:mediator of RNA polymerase II transcription subunit 31 [Quercus suber]|uniref:mediator of RNA polymerase II transcription subunit 31 n=1 Tax=Quercus suber TaxID=58331 RepID=UPI0032DFA3D0